MKFITIAVVVCLALAIQTALAAGTVAQDSSDAGMKIATDLLLREDLSEPAPAKEEKADFKKKQEDDKELKEAPLMADEVQSEDAGAPAEQGESPAKPADAAATEVKEDPQSAPGSLAYEMDTVSLLADAPAVSTYEKAPAAASLAKR